MHQIVCVLVCALLLFSGCLAQPTGTIAECESKATLTLRDVCYYEKGVAANNASYCTQIIDSGQRNQCLNTVT